MRTPKQLFNDLLGTLIRESENNKITITNVELFVQEWREKAQKANIEPILQALEMVADYYCVDIDDLRSSSRKAPLPDIRAVFYQYCIDEGHHPTVIAEAVNRDRTTVLHALKNIEYWGDLREKYRNFVKTL